MLGSAPAREDPLAFTVTFPTISPGPDAEAVAGWLTEVGEPYERDAAHGIVLRALPIRLDVQPEQPMVAHLEVTPTVPLERMVNLLFSLSMRAGSDVRLAGAGEVSRAALWLHLAEEQDRLRIAAALARATERGNTEVHRRLWALLGASRPGQDRRWDTERAHVVELREVGSEDMDLETARWHADNPVEGELIALPIADGVHTLAWRWLSEAYPGLCEP